MAVSPHLELITVLTQLYTLLISLAAVPDDLLRLTSPDTGVHAPGSINTTAAVTADYDADVVALICALPYLDVGSIDWSVELLPSTHPVTYFGPGLDEGDFESQREMMDDELMPATTLRLTWSEIYGVVFVYDIATKLMTTWKPFDNPDDVHDYSHVPAGSPREVLGPIIKAYRTLDYLWTPDGVDFNEGFFSASGGQPPKDYGLHDAHWFRAQYAVWSAGRKR